MSQVPELLSPAGSLDKLKVSVLYGADAVYVGGPEFGLRAAGDNLTNEELTEGVNFAHIRGAKVFVALNGFLHDSDLDRLGPFCEFLQSLGVDAVICSDLGVIETVRECSDLPIHLSTQASCLNSYAAKWWKSLGIHRVILAREVSLDEAKAIKENTGLEIELFVHGSLCMSYSGNCVISNYTAGRDSNRGGCAHSCRFSYVLKGEGQQERSLFMSSKDLQGLEVLHEYVRAGVDSVKIEGRMKGEIYAATSTKVYREALDFWDSKNVDSWKRELASFSHRDYTLASLISPAGQESLYHDREELKKSTHRVVGTVQAVSDDEMVIKVKNSFVPGDSLEVIPFKGETLTASCGEIKSLSGKTLNRAVASSLVRIKAPKGAEKWNMVRAVC